jgi:GNAT superfamily N-acetyltransferase
MHHLNAKRTSTSDPDFMYLIPLLDNELWIELQEDQSLYEQYNNVPGISTAIVFYDKEKPIACGCYKEHNTGIVEIKRMFVEKNHRGNGIAKLVLEELENWAIQNGFQYAILETSIHFAVAKNLYYRAGYIIIPNYDQYKGLEESICMKKKLM